MILNQSYRDIFSIAIISSFLGLSLYKLTTVFTEGFTMSWEAIAVLGVIVLLSLVIYLLSQARLKLKIGKKKISISINPLSICNIKFKRSNIADLEFFKTDALTKSSGLFIHFGGKERVFNFGGNKGMQLRLNNGKVYTFFSSHLYDQKEEIESMLLYDTEG